MSVILLDKPARVDAERERFPQPSDARPVCQPLAQPPAQPMSGASDEPAEHVVKSPLGRARDLLDRAEDLLDACANWFEGAPLPSEKRVKDLLADIIEERNSR